MRYVAISQMASGIFILSLTVVVMLMGIWFNRAGNGLCIRECSDYNYVFLLSVEAL